MRLQRARFFVCQIVEAGAEMRAVCTQLARPVMLAENPPPQDTLVRVLPREESSGTCNSLKYVSFVGIIHSSPRRKPSRERAKSSQVLVEQGGAR